MLRSNQEILIVVVPMSAIREFIAVDMIGSTAFYYTLKLALRKLIFVDIFAIAGSIILPIVYKQIFHRKPSAEQERTKKIPMNKASGTMA
ncbi:hypothetical protein [Paenibacillus kobensis]|uniref:hypothetical protein n=1 Tax=Paenibacillus kobensis TaxID=59841 RepID=UPI000FD95D00|nr:hypothetical protein [Paenibacillus kobensis]